MDKVSPMVALHLSLQSQQCKAVQDVMSVVSIDTEDHWAPVRTATDKLPTHISGQGSRKGLKQQRMSEVKPDMMLTPSISIVLFTLDPDPQMSKLEHCRQMFDKSPWKFHHLTEVNTTKGSNRRIHAKQEFFEFFPDLPLFSLNTTHVGDQILRINIVTCNHKSMVEFYSSVFNRPPVHVRADFCFFTFEYRENLTLQLALKSTSALMPYPMDDVELVLTLNTLPNELQLQKISDDLYSVVDPDDNCLLLRHTKDLTTDKMLEKQSEHTETKQEPTDQPTSLTISKKLLNAEKKTTKPSDLVEVSGKVESLNAFKRPDVIPSQDRYITSLACVSNEKVSKQRGGSPFMRRRSLVVCSKVTKLSTSQECLLEVNNNNMSQHQRRNSIDVLETF